MLIATIPAILHLSSVHLSSVHLPSVHLPSLHIASLAAQNNPFATHAWRAPAWIPAVPAVAYVIGKSVWSAIKRKALADHLRANPPAIVTALPAPALSAPAVDQ